VQGQVPAPVPFAGRTRIQLGKVLDELGRLLPEVPGEVGVQGQIPSPISFFGRRRVLFDEVPHDLG
jgi:hypothetical protein